MLNWAQTDDLLSYDINPQITPPSPLQVASRHGELPRRLQLAHFPSPRGKSALATHQLAKRWGGGMLWLGLAHFHNEYSFLMISQKLYDISLFFLLIPFSFLNSASFDTN
jgi:hypothetical protein